MSNQLINQLRKNRSSSLVIDGVIIKTIRPTQLEYWGLIERAGGSNHALAVLLLKDFVIGWDANGINLGIPGGDANPIDFSSDLFIEWVGEKTERHAGVTKHIFESYANHYGLGHKGSDATALDVELGKQKPG